MGTENSFSLAPVPFWRSGSIGYAWFICGVPYSSSELAFSGEWHLETKTWVLSVLIARGCHYFSWALSMNRARK